MNDRFLGNSQQDAHEFVTFFLDALHEDVNRVKHKPQTKQVQYMYEPVQYMYMCKQVQYMYMYKQVQYMCNVTCVNTHLSYILYNSQQFKS